MANQRKAGLIQFKVNGEIRAAKGNFTYNMGAPKRETMVGSDGTHGFKEVPQIAFIEGAITDQEDLDVKAMLTITDATVTLELANGKTVLLSEAYFAGDGNASTEEGEITVRFEGSSAEEV